MKRRLSFLAVAAASYFLLMATPRARAGAEIKYPSARPEVTFNAPDDWKPTASKDGLNLTLAPSSAGGVYKIAFQGLPNSTSGVVFDVCTKRAEIAMKETGIQPVTVHPPERDNTDSGTQFAVSYCIFKESGQERRCFLTVISPKAGKYYQATVYFNTESDEGTAQKTLVALLQSIKPL